MLPTFIKSLIHPPELWQPPGLPIVGERLRIRLFTRQDEDRRQHWRRFHEPYLSKFNFPPQGTDQNDRTYQKLQDRLRLAVDDAHGELIGYISLKPYRRNAAIAELGVCFAADRVSQGYGAEALRIVIGWAYPALGLKRIILFVDAINERAVKLYERLGFVKVSSTWKQEDNPSLQAYLIHRGYHSGSRCRGQKLELLVWKMERPEAVI
jgi:RimJ/RimL family protein N-acetyltransferase